VATTCDMSCTSWAVMKWCEYGAQVCVSTVCPSAGLCQPNGPVNSRSSNDEQRRERQAKLAGGCPSTSLIYRVNRLVFSLCDTLLFIVG
jgi:hypothetical protein